MRGHMMGFPLTIPALLRRTETFWGDRPVVTREPDRTVTRSTYGHCLARARRLAVALTRAGIEPGDRVATFCWNHQSHLETYYAVPMAGAVLHTLNLRLHASDLGYIVGHAEDKAIIIDAWLADAFLKFCDRMRDRLVIVVGGGADRIGHGAVNYEDFIADIPADAYEDRVT